MISLKVQSLNRALEYASLQSHGLPRLYVDGRDPFWFMAVVLVRKSTLEELLKKSLNRLKETLKFLGLE